MYSRKAAYVLLLLAIISGLYFLRSYLGVFALAALTTLLFAPVHNWFLHRKRRVARYSTGLTLAVAILTFVIPVVAVLGLSFYQGSQIVSDLRDSHILDRQQLNTFADKTTTKAGKFGVRLSKDTVSSKLEDAARKAAPTALSYVSKKTGSIAKSVTELIVYFLLLWTMLSRKDKIIRLLKRLSPLDDKINEEYFRKIKAITISSVRGTFIIAVVIGFIGALTLWIAGVPYAAFWFLLFTALSLIPLGAGIIFVPIGVVLLLMGDVWQGVLILLVQFIVLNNVDNVLRPRLAPKESKLPGALLLIGTFAGVSYFGVLGVVYGPIIMILLFTTIEIYDRHRDTGIPVKNGLAS